MKPEARKTFYISISMIFLLSVISLWRMRDVDYSDISFSFPISESIPAPSFDDLANKNLEEIMKEQGIISDEDKEEIRYVRKTIAEELFFDYPSSWKEEKMQKGTIKGAEPLFFGYSENFLSPVVITVLKIKENDIKKATAFLEKMLEEDGARRIQKIDEKIDEKKHLLKISYEERNGANVILSSALVFKEDICYVVSVGFFEDRPPAEKTVDYILSSVRITN